MREVLVVRTGIANVASVLAGLSRLECSPRLTDEGGEIEAAPYLVLPGVGSFGAAMEHLHGSQLVEPLRRRFEKGLHTLAICLGMQLMAEMSEESPGVPGLAVFPGAITKFPSTVRVPQLGWNNVEPGDGCRLLVPGEAYFANSFRLLEAPQGWRGAVSEHGGHFLAALERGPILACQFHPELSGRWGLQLMKRWLEASC